MKGRTVIVILAIFWAFNGLNVIFSGILTYLQPFFLTNWTMAQDDYVLGILIAYRTELTVVQLLWGALVLVCSFAFFHRKQWARLLLQFFAVLNIFWGVCFFIVWLSILGSTTLPDQETAFFRASILIVVGMGVLVFLVVTGIWVFCIWILNRPTVKSEFSHSTPS